MTRWLEYRAGRAALQRIRAQGFSPAAVGTFVAPAAGPKWLVAAGFDRALIRERLLERGGPVLLAGSSAGAWRSLAFASPEPLRAHATLLEEYVGKVFTERDTPEGIGAAYRESLRRVVPDAHAAHVLAHTHYRLAIHATRAKGWIAARGVAQKLGLSAAVLGNALAPRSQALFFGRTLFVSEAAPAAWFAHARSERTALTADNLLAVALASGSVPMYMAHVAIPGRDAMHGYLDGGLTDYHLSQRLGDPDALALLFSHTRRIIPNWFDKYLPHRAPSAHVTDNLLLVYPSREFVQRLPDGRVPDREDFTKFMRAPEERIRRWRAAVAESERLGDQFSEDVSSGRVPELVRAL